MKPVMQTIANSVTGDCLPACLASILELEIQQVPNFVALYDDEHWWEKLQEWLEESNLYAIEIPYSLGHCPVPEGVFCIVSGRTAFSENILHSCVARFGPVSEGGQPLEIVHDPDPAQNNIINIRELLFLAKKDLLK